MMRKPYIMNSTKRLVSKKRLWVTTFFIVFLGSCIAPCYALAKAKVGTAQAQASEQSGAANGGLPTVGMSVNPQTGSLSMSDPMANLPGKHQLNLDIALHYDGATQSNRFGIAPGWSLGFTYFDTNTQRFHFSSGHTYRLKVDSKQLTSLQDYKLKNIQVSATPGTIKDQQGLARNYHYQIHSVLRGSDEYLDGKGRLIQLRNQYGDKIDFYYFSDNSFTIKSIRDTFGNVVTFQYGSTASGQKTIQILLPGKKDPYIYYLDGDKVVSIVDPLHHTTTINYEAIGGQDRPYQVILPSGASITAKYSSTPMAYEGDTKASNLYYVYQLTQSAGFNQPDQVTHYTFDTADPATTHNYTGTPDLGFSTDGQDQLLHEGSDQYRYTVTTTSGKMVKTSTYNHLHLLTDTVIKSTDTSDHRVQTVHYEFPGEGEQYDNLPANYQRPSTIVKTFQQGGTSRSITSKLSYDDYGSVVSGTSFNGVTKVIDYGDISTNPLHLPMTVTTKSPDGQVATQVKMQYDDQAHFYNLKNTKTYSGNQLISTTTLQYSPDNKFLQSKVTTLSSDLPHVLKRAVTTVKTKQETQYNTPAAGQYTVTQYQCKQDGSCVKAGESVFQESTGLLLSVKDVDGNVVTKHYDEMNRLTDVYSQAKGGTPVHQSHLDYVVSNSENSVTITNEVTGLQTKVCYDGLGRKISTYDNTDDSVAKKEDQNLFGQPLHQVATYQYNQDGQLAQQTNTLTQQTVGYYYDFLGRKTAVYYPNGTHLIHVYDDVANTVTSYRNDASFENDTFHQVVTSNNGGQTTHVENRPQGSSTSVNSGAPIDTDFHYDTLNRLKQTMTRLKSSSLTYLPYNKVGTATYTDVDPDSKAQYRTTISTAYDPLIARVTRTTLTNERGETKVGYKTYYNALGQKTEFREPQNPNDPQALQKSIYMQYRTDGLVSEKESWSGDKFHYDYTSLDGQEVVADMYPDDKNNSGLDESTLHGGVHYAYNKSRMLSTLSFKDGSETIHYYYYADGKLRATVYDPGTKQERVIYHNYNKEGQLATVTDAAGKQTSYDYDPKTSALLSATSSDGGKVSYTYDPVTGCVKTRTMENNGKPVGSVSYDYNPEGAVADVTYKDQNGNQTRYVEYVYKTDGKVWKKTTYTSDQSKQVEEQIEYTYSHANGSLIQSTTSKSDPGSLDSLHVVKTVTYNLDIGGNVLGTTVSVPSHKEMGVAVKASTTQTQNRYNYLDQIQTFNSQTGFDFDKNGNMDLDEQGNRYQHNAGSQLISFTRASDRKKVSYEYYPDGTLKSKTDASSGKKVQFFYDGATMINELYTGGATSTLSSYLIGATREARTVNGNTSFYNYDSHGSVLSSLVSDGSDDWSSHYFHYTNYGQLDQQTLNLDPFDSSYDGFRYSGQYLDAASGLYYLHARWYSPRLKRFVERDAVNSMNLYAYCGGNPITRIDPTGQSFISVMKTVGKMFLSQFKPGVNLDITLVFLAFSLVDGVLDAGIELADIGFHVGRGGIPKSYVGPEFFGEILTGRNARFAFGRPTYQSWGLGLAMTSVRELEKSALQTSIPYWFSRGQTDNRSWCQKFYGNLASNIAMDLLAEGIFGFVSVYHSSLQNSSPQDAVKVAMKRLKNKSVSTMVPRRMLSVAMGRYVQPTYRSALGKVGMILITSIAAPAIQAGVGQGFDSLYGCNYPGFWVSYVYHLANDVTFTVAARAVGAMPAALIIARRVSAAGLRKVGTIDSQPYSQSKTSEVSLPVSGDAYSWVGDGA